MKRHLFNGKRYVSKYIKSYIDPESILSIMRLNIEHVI